jgi:hypothetical protein
MARKDWPGVAVLLLTAICAIVVFRGADFFEDNLYNIGVILRSAAAQHGPLLQTSQAVDYYARYPIERAENWHRGLSLLVASFAVRVTGTPSMIGLLHCVYLGIFGGLLFAMVRRAALDGPKPSDQGVKRRANWIALTVLAAIALNPFGLLILSRSAMEDIPAGCFILAGLTLLLRDEFPSASTAALAGLLFGGAFWGKDIALLWAGLGSLILAIGLLSGKPELTLTRLYVAAVPGLVALPVVGSKLLWNRIELGTWLPTMALIENRILIFGSFSGFSSHFPYYLTGDARIGSAIEVAGGLIPAVKAAILVQVQALQALMLDLAPVLPLLLAALFIPPQFTATRPYFARIGRATSTAVVVYLCFFLSGAGTLDELRYWIVPISLGAGLGLIFAVEFWDRQQFRLPRRQLIAGALIYVVGVCQVPSAYFGLRKPPLIPQSVVAWTHHSLEAGAFSDTVALNGRRAFYYYSRTGDRVATIWPAALASLGSDKSRQWLSDYDVRWAILQDSDEETRKALETFGFTQAYSDGGYVVLKADAARL